MCLKAKVLNTLLYANWHDSKNVVELFTFIKYEKIKV